MPIDQPPEYRDSIGHLKPEYRTRTLDLDAIVLRVYWWVDGRFSTEKTSNDGRRWGWRWQIWSVTSEEVYETAAQASWAGLEASLELLDAARRNIKAKLKKRAK